mmetsp:Transcript_19867/g.31571  ORF Transcript_19867/g.31571 Transcript_19867/m.31571 type:complete len:518 (-) Transcript_19867:296-1849(-)
MKYIAATVLLATMAFGASVTPTPKPTQMPTPSPVDPSQSITVWADQSVDMLYCVSDECGGDGHGEPDYLSICYEDIPCRNLLQCANQCPINSEEHTKCVAANCKAPILAATNRLNSLGKFYNLTSCMIKNCPRDEDAILRREKQEIKQDNECLNATVPLLAEMNHDTVTADNCYVKLNYYDRKVESIRSTCPMDFDTVWSDVRNFLTYSASRHNNARCLREYSRLKRTVKDVVAFRTDQRTEDEEDEDDEYDREARYRAASGETESCSNIRGDEDVPWLDSDGDSCTVYVQNGACKNGHLRVARHFIHVACNSHDCKGTKGLYADRACCACGGGDYSGSPYHPVNIQKRTKAIYGQRCMLAACVGKLGECQQHSECIGGLSCISNKTCPLGVSLNECKETCAPGIPEDAGNALLNLMKCAGAQNTRCVDAALNPVVPDPSSRGDDPSSTGGSGGSGDGGDEQPVGLIVTMTIIGAIIIGGGVFGGYTWWKQRQNEHQFRRVQINDDDGQEAILEPEL